MPYRHAHWYLLALFPLLGAAFWPTYFSKLAAAPLALHAHAVTGTLWIGVLAAQSWMIHHGRRDIHRQVGITSFAIFTAFMAVGAAVSVILARQFVATPQAAVAPEFGLVNLLWVSGFAYCYFQALRQRRTVHAHSRYMLSTVLFLLPPIFGRLAGYVPRLRTGPQGVWLAVALAAGIAFFLAVRPPRHGRPFIEAGCIIAVSGVLFDTVGAMSSWHRLYAHLANVPSPVFEAALGLTGIMIAYGGWVAGNRPHVGIAPA